MTHARERVGQTNARQRPQNTVQRIEAREDHPWGYRCFVPIETLTMCRKDYDLAAEVVKVLVAAREAIKGLK